MYSGCPQTLGLTEREIDLHDILIGVPKMIEKELTGRHLIAEAHKSILCVHLQKKMR
jgi:hypothetical protein